MNSAYFWNIIFLMAIGTFSIRGSFIFLSSKIQMSERTKEIFSFIPSAILPALIAPAVFYHNGQVEWLLHKERFLVICLATLFWFTNKSMFLTIAFGLTTLYLFSHMGL